MPYRTPASEGSALDDQLERLSQKLRRLGSKDRLHEAFGSTTHKYRWGPVLPPEALAESGMGELLPVDFRRFVTEVGNGGAGPYYGWSPFEPSLLARAERRPFVADEGDRHDFATIMLHDHGCGMYDFLVVQGEGAGEVWASCDDCRAHPYGLSFVDHLEAWLELQLVKPGSFLTPRWRSRA